MTRFSLTCLWLAFVGDAKSTLWKCDHKLGATPPINKWRSTPQVPLCVVIQSLRIDSLTTFLTKIVFICQHGILQSQILGGGLENKTWARGLTLDSSTQRLKITTLGDYSSSFTLNTSRTSHVTTFMLTFPTSIHNFPCITCNVCHLVVWRHNYNDT